MFRTNLRNFPIAKTHELRMKCNKQRVICFSIRKTARRRYNETLNLKHITDNKKFRATVKYDMVTRKNLQNTLIYKIWKNIRNEKKLEKNFNNFSVKIVLKLEISNIFHFQINIKYLNHLTDYVGTKINSHLEKSTENYASCFFFILQHVKWKYFFKLIC